MVGSLCIYNLLRLILINLLCLLYNDFQFFILLLEKKLIMETFLNKKYAATVKENCGYFKKST